MTEENTIVDESFGKWAVGFSGCDGGNPHGKAWVCGIEWGGGHTKEDLKFPDVTKPASIGGSGWSEADIEQFQKYQYNQKALKLLSALAGGGLSYRDFFRASRCFQSDSEYFKMNLYPLAFKNVSSSQWQEWLAERTGFSTKEGYVAWCKDNRFPVLKQWVKTYCPELIVCTGIGCRDDFFAAFTDRSDMRQDRAGGKNIFYKWTNGGRTLVAVTYFLGQRHGLKSDSELLETGKKLAELLSERSVPTDAA